MRLGAPVLYLLVAACGTPARAPAAKIPAVTGALPGRPTPAKPLGRAVPLVLPDTRDVAAPWLEPPLDAVAEARPWPLGELRLAGAGRHVALLRARAGVVLALHDERGPLGLLTPPPRTTWLGVDARDRLYAATSDGDLFRSDDPKQPFTKRGRVPGAIAWDVATLLVASDGARVYVSRDGGARFAASAPAPREQIVQVLTRADEFVVARGKITWVRPRGEPWQAAAFQPGGPLARLGGDIFREGHARLSADGMTWSSYLGYDQGYTNDYEEAAPVASWLLLAEPLAQAAVQMVPRLPGAFYPAPADPPAPGDEVVGPEPPDPIALPADPDAEAYLDKSDCDGLSCLLYAPPPSPLPTRRRVDFLGAGICATQLVDGLRECTADPPAYPAPLVWQDREHDRVTLAPLPSGCERQAQTYAVPGLYIVTCEDTDARVTTLFVATSPGEWAEELHWNGRRLGAVQTASDGTLLLDTGRVRERDEDGGRTPCVLEEDENDPSAAPRTYDCGVFVRAPRGAGEGSPWRHVELTGAIVHRPLTGGAVLAVRSHDDATWFDLVQVRPGEAPVLLVTLTETPSAVTALEVTAEGYVRLTDGDGGQTIVSTDGRLITSW